MPQNIGTLILAAGLMFGVLGVIAVLSNFYTLNIKDKTVGNGQHGTARWATQKEIARTYVRADFTPQLWRQGKNLPKEQGIVVGCKSSKAGMAALVDTGDVHAMMIGAAGMGKTAYWLYPCIEYALASGMSFVSTDTKGDIFRNYSSIARDSYGYKISIIDLRNPSRSDGFNLLHLVNKYTDLYKTTNSLTCKAKAEKYAKIIAKTIVMAGEDTANFGQNQFFYDAAEGLLTSVILLSAEFCRPEERHIVSIFKLIQELLAPSKVKGKTLFHILMDTLPPEHKARWFAGAALSSSEQAMASIMSTALARLNAFLDSELEQLLCFGTAVDAETFCKEKSAIFLVMPEEDPGKFFMVSLVIQQLYIGWGR